MSDIVCHVREGLDEGTRGRWREACKKLDFYCEQEGKRYCVLHYPGEDKKDDVREVVKRKLEQKDYVFSGTVFPEGTSGFQGFKFDANANFTGATFLGKADFRGAQFSNQRTDF